MKLSLVSTAARADEPIVDIGHRLSILAESGMAGDRGVLLNGQVVAFHVVSTEHSMATSLDLYEEWCRKGSDKLDLLEHSLVRVSDDKQRVLREPEPTETHSWNALTHVATSGNMGVVTCFKPVRAGKNNSKSFGERMASFAHHGNLAELGNFYLISASRAGSRTRIVRVSTKGDFFPIAMFPLRGDAPGFDVRGMSRPPSGRRLLSAGEVGSRNHLIAYTDCIETVMSLSRFYKKNFDENGWLLIQSDYTEDGSKIFVVQKNNMMSVVVLSSAEGLSSVMIASSESKY